ncbi:MAG: ABC transporter substrate-binding protein [Hyphomicrobiales bacterium]
MNDEKKLITPKKSLIGLSRRKLLKTGAAATVMAGSVNMFNINHAWSQDVVWDGQPFDGEGTTIRINEWGGFWQEFMQANVIEEFERTYNCSVAYDSSFPWFPKYVASGAKDPAFHMGNWNLNEIIKLGKAGDFFMSTDEIKANVPNAADLWDFAFGSGLGATWGFGQYAHVWRTDLIDPAPVGFRSFWEDRFADKRATYITSNGLFMTFFMTAAAEFGSGPDDMEAGFEAMRAAMPMKISDFTGNMQTQVERGEVEIGVQWEGEIFLQMDKDIPVAPLTWERKPILTQTHTVSRYSDPMEKKLSLALLNAKLDPAFQTKAGEAFYLRPTNSKAELPERLTSKGVKNTADALDGLWIPDWNWYLDNEDEIVETVNEIFAG